MRAPLKPVDREVTAEKLYRTLWPEMVRLGHLLTGSEALGEEIAQEAFIGVLRTQHSIEAPRAFVRRSVINLAINAGRQAERERRYLNGIREEPVPELEPDDLWPLVCQLPSLQRAVIVLRYYLDLSEADIAHILRCPPGTVKSRTSKALAHLNRELSRS